MKENLQYLVLARKYRPKDFSQLMGQDSLVKTINNSIKQNRVAHAFLLTGIRGIGKTTTARIIAKTLNCTNLDLKKEVLFACGECKNCTSCHEQSHPDILEFDAASKTGVNDIRDVIENATYAPIMGKYKIFIIDEVHMLSTSAFNALLKTLEEPPAHLKFIFATTEPRKIPLTIISRCQRHDLRRFSVSELKDLLASVCKQEDVKFEDNALNTISTYAQGSARDALSLLDTVILNSESKISTDFVETALGITNKANSFLLLEKLLQGEVEYCLKKLTELMANGIEPIYLLEDLLELCTNATKIVAYPDLLKEIALTDFEKKEIARIAKSADIPRLSRVWQILFKGINEIKSSDMPIQTIEMIFIRICYLSSQPTPSELVSQLKKKSNALNESAKNIIHKAEDEPHDPSIIKITDFGEIANLFKQNREMVLYHQLKQDIEAISVENNILKIKLVHQLEQKTLNNIREKLELYTNQKWQIVVCREQSSSKKKNTLEEKELEDIKNHEIIRKIFDNFQNSKIESIKTIK